VSSPTRLTNKAFFESQTAGLCNQHEDQPASELYTATAHSSTADSDAIHKQDWIFSSKIEYSHNAQP